MFSLGRIHLGHGCSHYCVSAGLIRVDVLCPHVGEGVRLLPCCTAPSASIDTVLSFRSPTNAHGGQEVKLHGLEELCTGHFDLLFPLLSILISFSFFQAFPIRHFLWVGLWKRHLDSLL